MDTKLVAFIMELVDLRITQHIADKHTRKKRATKPKVSMFVGSFADFWEKYPRTDDKAGAVKEWAKLPAELFLTIMTAVKAQKRKGGRLADKKYAPHARKWLHGKGWLDPVESVDKAEEKQRFDRKNYLAKERAFMVRDTLWLLDIGVGQQERDKRLKGYKEQHPVRAKMFEEIYRRKAK